MIELYVLATPLYSSRCGVDRSDAVRAKIQVDRAIFNYGSWRGKCIERVDRLKLGHVKDFNVV